MTPSRWAIAGSVLLFAVFPTTATFCLLAGIAGFCAGKRK